ncbi:hypothetical protein GCK72_007123 [Caenorhabditis remanei]|uniref:Uncharacterized protein n=1 Tax=Caenorhabditis remanei TaxID=31234 RepID=A0A6A5HKP2_CAERE|nr:hypothetical protein GCK72_007123 [Caenorhabditis remanei]KAF1767164.1 hypothetical protein GCK72_007123 [Caenorhabditis remanei]
MYSFIASKGIAFYQDENASEEEVEKEGEREEHYYEEAQEQEGQEQEKKEQDVEEAFNEKLDVRYAENEEGGVHFDLKAAQKHDLGAFLPGGKSLFLTSLLTPAVLQQCSGETVTQGIEKTINTLLNEVSIRDPFFIIYGTSVSARSCQYPQIETRFYDVFGQVLQKGLKVPDSVFTMGQLVTKIRGATKNFISRKRTNRVLVEDLLADFTSYSRRNKLFQFEEPPVHVNCPWADFVNSNEAEESISTQHIKDLNFFI